MQDREYVDATIIVGEAYVSRDVDRIRDVMCPHGGDPDLALEQMALYEGPVYVPVVELVHKLEFVERTDGKIRVDLPLLPAPAAPDMSVEDLENFAVGFLVIHFIRSASGFRTCLYDVLASY
jgi:hypothetical protein